jgi:peptide/nickel transport system permease protein
MKDSYTKMSADDVQRVRNFRNSSAKKSPQLLIGIFLTGFVVMLTLTSFFWTPWDPLAIDVENRLLPPNLSHWFGTDRLGRDLFSQIMVGSQNTLYVTLVSTFIGVAFGTSLGLAAAGSGRLWGAVFTRISDIGIALPSILIALVLATTLGPGRLSVIIAISFWFVPVTARVVVGPARQVLALDFVEAAMTHGRSRRYILFKQVIPNIAPILIVQTSMMFAAGILIEASLSFLGVGAQPPTTSWGKILMDSQPLVQQAPYYTILPGAFIVITVLGFNLLGDGLAVLLDPQQSKKGVV